MHSKCKETQSFAYKELKYNIPQYYICVCIDVTYVLKSHFACFFLLTVLLANVSALSAIRYLRKYVKADKAASDEKQHLAT